VPSSDISDLERYAEARRAEARRLEAELPALNERLGIARSRQEALQRPSVLVTERLPQRLVVLRERVRSRRRRT
jgi:hypothetical protein